MFRYLRRIAGICCLLIIPLTGFAESAPAPARDTLVAALAEVDYPPFYFVSDGKLTGISIDVLEHVATELGLHVRYRRLSWPRVQQALKQGDVDMVTTYFYTPERARTVVYCDEPHTAESNQLFTRIDSGITFDGDLQSLAGHLIGTIKGYSYGAAFDHANDLKKDGVLDERTLVRMVLGHRFNLAIGNPFAIRLEAQRQGGLDQLQFLAPAVDRSPIYMAFSRRDARAEELAEKFTQRIRQLKTTPKYRAMVSRYGLDDANPATPAEHQD